MNSKIYPLLLCGGSGTRLWPLSRKLYPKQFARLMGEESLFQASVRRVQSPGFAAPSVVTSEEYRFIVAEQMAALETAPASILLEPCSRNTAPAICAAALSLDKRAPNALMLVTPSDHVIPDVDRFRATLQAAAPAALAGSLVTFGIRPSRPETGYGWLEMSEAPDPNFAPVSQPIRAFVEKPDHETAVKLLAGGRHLWNAGIFLFTTTAIIDAFRKHVPEVLKVVEKALDASTVDLGFTRLEEQAWAEAEDVSVDYAIMERASDISVVPYAGTWSDLGGWNSVWQESGPDDEGLVTNGPVTTIDCKNSLLRAEHSGQELVGIGLDNIIAIAMSDAVLIAHKERGQDVKLAVQKLKAKRVRQAESSPRDLRPWGWFESLVIGGRFQVKRIVVNPGAALSLQSHHHRAEHWIVVEGTAKVTIDETVRLVTENQSVFIPLGAVHRMENPGKLPMVLIEVQTGSYLGEDDIVRYEDVYNRNQKKTSWA